MAEKNVRSFRIVTRSQTCTRSEESTKKSKESKGNQVLGTFLLYNSVGAGTSYQSEINQALPLSA